MTKFQIMSDTHQEHYKKQSIRKEHIIGDVLLLAGDATEGSESVEYLKDLGIPVYYILGNHEHYDRHWDGCLEDYRLMFKNSNVHILENDTLVYNNVRIIGTTLWTDFIAPVKDKPFFDTTGKNTVGDEYYLENQAFYCKHGMADFNYIKAISISGWLERNQKSRQYIRMMLSEKHDGTTIVLTHHAPSFKSSHKRWDDSAIKGGFCSNLEWLIEEYNPEYWVHGHCHESFDYYINKTRIICNPKGYVHDAESTFNPSLIIEL